MKMKLQILLCPICHGVVPINSDDTIRPHVNYGVTCKGSYWTVDVNLYPPEEP